METQKDTSQNVILHQFNRWMYRDTQTDRQTYTQTNRHIQTDITRQTDRDRERRNREKETDRQLYWINLNLYICKLVPMGSLEKIVQTNVTTRVKDVMMLMVPVTRDVILAGLGTIAVKVKKSLFSFLLHYALKVYTILLWFFFWFCYKTVTEK